MVASFGTGNPSAPARLVENTPKVLAPRHAGLARERLVVVIDGVRRELEVERQERHLGGTQAFWRCGQCSSLRSHLYVVGGVLACRVCLGLRYRRVHPAVIRAAKLRRKLGGEPGLLSPVPRKPRHWSPVTYARAVSELAAQERVIAGLLGGIVHALERRKGRLHGPR
jgi:hypothetical protein